MNLIHSIAIRPRSIIGPISLTEHVMTQENASKIYIFGDGHSTDYRRLVCESSVSICDLISSLVSRDPRTTLLLQWDTVLLLEHQGAGYRDSGRSPIDSCLTELYAQFGTRPNIVECVDIRHLDRPGSCLCDGLGDILRDAPEFSSVEALVEHLVCCLEDFAVEIRPFSTEAGINKWIDQLLHVTGTRKQMDKMDPSCAQIMDKWWKSKIASFDLGKLNTARMYSHLKASLSGMSHAKQSALMKQLVESWKTMNLILVAAMDMYAIATAMLALNHGQKPILYCGETHAENQRQLMELLGAKETFRVHSRDGKEQRIDISDLDWPMFQ